MKQVWQQLAVRWRNFLVRLNQRLAHGQYHWAQGKYWDALRLRPPQRSLPGDKPQGFAFFISNSTRQALFDLGFPADAVKQLSPQQAMDIVDKDLTYNVYTQMFLRKPPPSNASSGSPSPTQRASDQKQPREPAAPTDGGKGVSDSDVDVQATTSLSTSAAPSRSEGPDGTEVPEQPSTALMMTVEQEDADALGAERDRIMAGDVSEDSLTVATPPPAAPGKQTHPGSATRATATQSGSKTDASDLSSPSSGPQAPSANNAKPRSTQSTQSTQPQSAPPQSTPSSPPEETAAAPQPEANARPRRRRQRRRRGRPRKRGKGPTLK